MGDCCEDKACDITALRVRQGAVLKTVLVINAVMFFVEGAAGVMAHSNALVADSLDMLGDALVYGLSIYVLSRGARWRAGSALVKGLIMAGFGLFALVMAVYHLIRPALPVAEAIGGVGLLVLAANSLCLFMLWRHRSDDINMHSVWLCSRNDIIANVSVIFAGIGVWLTASGWPDLLVGLAISLIFLRSAYHVILRAVGELRMPQA